MFLSALRTPARPGRRSRLRMFAAAAATTCTLAGAATVVAPTTAAHATAPSRAATAIRYELAQIGKPYRWGAEGPNSFDCSGLTQAAYRYAGISIPRVSRDQYRYLPHVRIANLQPGDLVFWGRNRSDASSVYHVATYLGNGMILAAPYTGTVVQIKKMSTRNLMPYGARPAGRSAAAPIPVQVGEVSNAVRVVQSRLRANGFNVAVDGEYGRSTWTAVHKLQLRLGTPGTGLVGPNTWGYLVSHGRFRSTP